MKSVIAITAISLLASGVTAQVGAWGQCGGIGFTGGTTCVSGYYCNVLNPYYSQCIPGTATASPTSTKATSTSSASKTSTTSVAGPTATSTPSTGYVTTSGTEFRLNGKKFYFVGSNAYWLTYLTNNADIDYALDQFKASGMKVLRIWGFGDYTSSQGSNTAFQIWSGSTATINTGATGLQRLDYIVSAAAARGVKLIIPFVNNWNDYGGIKVYVDAFASGQGHDAFYTNANIKTAYKKYVNAVVSRYKTSPAIFAWELANEARCSGGLASSGSCTPAKITAWVGEMSAYIKSLDSNHLVTDGSEGFFNRPSSSDWFYNGGEGVDFEAILSTSTIDFATFHLYPSHWSKDYNWGTQFIKDHGTAAATINKPVVLEEYGIPRDTGVRTAELQKWHTAVLGSKIAGDMYWQFGTTLPNNGKTHDDGFAIFTSDSDFGTLVTSYVTQMEAKNA
ncbi:glycoside hydrolase [Peziza echinospora]|nr:glycoside hydrolase [Peziza echinospora]